MIWFVYYSNSGCTARFVHDYILGTPELRIGGKARRVFARSPHGAETGTASSTAGAPPVEPKAVPEFAPRPTDTVILCVPTYGRFDHRLGRNAGFVPKCLRPWVIRADAAVVFGNRNFGADYCAARWELDAICAEYNLDPLPILAEVEMSGDPYIARTIVREAMILDGLDPDDPRLPSEG